MNREQKTALRKLQSIETPSLVVPAPDRNVYDSLVRMGKAWIYKQDDEIVEYVPVFEIKEVEAGDDRAWKQGPGGWRWVHQNAVIAKIETSETRTRMEDWTGVKKCRYRIQQDITITVKVLSVEFSFDLTMYGGEQAVVREIIGWGTDWLWQQCHWEARSQAYRLDINHLDILNAETAGMRTAKHASGTSEKHMAARLAELVQQRRILDGTY